MDNDYTQSEVDAMMEDTWKAAREWNGRTKKDFYWFLYPTLADYKATLPVQQENDDTFHWTDKIVERYQEFRFLETKEKSYGTTLPNYLKPTPTISNPK